MRVAVYTAIFGGYDNAKPFEPQDIDCDFYCFTDSDHPSDGWQYIRTPQAYGHPRTQAKRFKLLSHLIFPDGRLAENFRTSETEFSAYDATIWIDGSIMVSSPHFAKDMIGRIRENGWALFRHTDRDDVLEEAAFSSKMRKYEGLPIFEQAVSYIARGLRPHSGLYQGGVIVRKEPLSDNLRYLNEAWWNENRLWSFQDQISLPFAMHITNTSVDVMEENIWHNTWFRWYEHHLDKEVSAAWK